MGQESKQYWSMTEGVFNCLIDEERTEAFRRAINNTVKPGDIVVDMGTGSGILAMLAVKAGAKKVYAVELDKNNISYLNGIFKHNKVSENIEVIHGDVTTVSLPERVDVVIGEMIATALIEELQVLAMNNILRFTDNNTRVLLKEYKTYVDLVNNNEKYYDHVFKIIRYEYPDLKKLKSEVLSPRYLISSIDFSKVNENLEVDKNFEIKINKKGAINGIRLSGDTVFFDNSILGATFAYSYPIIIPIDDIDVCVGDVFKVDISYKICGGMQTLKYSINK